MESLYSDSVQLIAYLLTNLSGLVTFIIGLLVVIIGRCTVLKKAGMPGWKGIIPIYSRYLIYKIAFGEGWYFLLSFILPVAPIINIILSLRLAKSFGKSTLFGILMSFFFPICLMILGVGEANYQGVQEL